MLSRKILSWLILPLILLFMVPQLSTCEAANQSTSKRKIVNFGLIFYNPTVERSQEIIDWVIQFNFEKWNFICEAGLTRNQTLIDFLKNNGCILGLPTISLKGVLPSQERIKRFEIAYNAFLMADVKLEGFFLFQPDTFVLNYAYSKGLSFYVGYCFEQYAVDYMTTRGGWQLPYYHSHEHALKPALDNKGLVVFPHLTWDWISSLTVSHELNTHILNAYDMCGRNQSRTIEYVKDLVEANLNMVEPFGYATVMFEWDWVMDLGLGDFAATLIKTLIDEYGQHAETYEETTGWFRASYSKTPTYHFMFESNFDDQQIEWYYDIYYRIAKVGNKIKSYVQFSGQRDFWRRCHWIVGDENLIPTNPKDSVDYSLSFIIDDLGGGKYRSPPRGGSFTYEKDLESFPIYLRFKAYIEEKTGSAARDVPWQ